MSDNIPLEIQAEIFKRLPAKPFVQCKSLSKSFKSLIESPEFIADYHKCQAKRQHLLVRWYDTEQYTHVPDPDYTSIVDDDAFPKHRFATTFPSDMPYCLDSRLKLVGGSQGLLCLFGNYFNKKGTYKEIAFIWNPSIKKSISVKIPAFHESYITVMGFGVCPNASDPMLVKLDDVPGPWNVFVFRLSSGRWRCSRGSVPRKSINYRGSQVAIDGFIYFMCYERCSNLIMSFDMTSEEFTEINLPNNLVHRDVRTVSISKLRESLVVLEYFDEGEKPVSSVWVLKHGVPNLFIKLFTIKTPDSIINKVLGFTKNGEPIMERKVQEDAESGLEVYEPSSEHVKDLGINGEPGSFFVASYSETLLLLGQSDY